MPSAAAAASFRALSAAPARRDVKEILCAFYAEAALVGTRRRQGYSEYYIIGAALADGSREPQLLVLNRTNG